MAHEKAIAEGFDSLWGKSSERNWILGRLGLPGGGTPVFDVPDKPGYKYVNRGAAGEQGQVIARDAIGVAHTYNQRVWMRYELGKYVIRDADLLVAGGGGGGASDLNALTDVTLTTPANGQTLQYNAATSQWINVVPAGGAGGAPSPHAHSSIHHTGQLPWVELDKTGSSLSDIQTRPHSLLTGITPDQHHNQAHVLATGTALGADHTISGAAVGEVLRALSATTAAFDVLQHTDLGNILPDQHHQRIHDIISGDTFGTVTGPVHTVVGADYTVIGVHPINTLAVLPTSNAPGAAISILRTDANGGIQLDTNLLYVDGANNRVGFNRTPSNAFGAAAVDIIAANNADHSQRISRKSGQTGRMWRIEDLDGSELIVLDSVGDLQSGHPGFVSGLTGWQITPQGNAEFNNIWARGELHATVFVKDEVHATGGTLLVATAGVLHDDANISSSAIDDDVLVVYSTPAGMGVPLQVVTTSGTFVGNELHVSFIGNTININDPPSGPGFYFQPGDVVRSKTEVDTGVTDFWLEVNSAVQQTGYSTYSVTKRSGTDGVLPKGSAVVSYGQQGDGRILMTSDLNYAPYIDVFTVGPNVWTGNAGSVVPRMRMGRLDGIGLPGISGVPQYGMIAGKDLSDANTGYLIASNLQFSLYKIDIRLNNGSNDTGLWTADGNLRIGKNVGADATTGFRVYTLDGGGYNAGDVVIGNTGTGNFLRWNQLTGTLQVVGSLVVSDPGTTVTLKYVDDQDKSYDLAAQGYGSSAQTNSQAYADARRVVGVTGSWDSPSSTTIRWGTKAVAGTPAGVAMSAAFGNATNRSIADHAGATVSVTSRTYLFVNVSGSGTMTMTATTSLATVMASVNNVLIAVADPGDTATKACSITVVAGSTYISGSNIFTGSIVAANIAAGTVTADKLQASSLTSTYLDPVSAAAAADATTKANAAQSNATSAAAADATTKANTAQSNATTAAATDATTKANQAAADAQVYGDARRVVGVTGTWTVVDGDTISWTGLGVKFANGSTRPITAQSNVTLSPGGRWYLYVDVSSTVAPATMPMETPTQTLASLSVNDVLIAVVDTGTLKASIHIVAGSTYISGGNIMTGSIVAANIAASTITADRMNVQRLDAMKGTFGTLLTGVIEMDTLSNLHTTGKVDFLDTTAGIFLGYDTNPNPNYKFNFGDANSYVRWGGAGLAMEIKSAGGLNITSSSASPFEVMSLFGQTGGVVRLYHVADNTGGNAGTGWGHTSKIKVTGLFDFDFEVLANKFVQLGDTLQLRTQRQIVSSASTGFLGEICWYIEPGTGFTYLYLCVATNTWRRIQFPGAGW